MPDPIKTLALISAGIGKPATEELERRERADESPRVTLFERELNADLLDERYLARVRGVRGFVYSRLPVAASQVIEALTVSRKYDVVVSWAEHLGMPLAALYALTGQRIPHIGIFSWISPLKKAELLKRVWKNFDTIVLMSSAQRDVAVTGLGIPPERVALLRWPVDQQFWRPMNLEWRGISAVGREMRDYGTLLRALRGTGIPCHIAAAGVVAGARDRWQEDVEREKPLPEGVTLGRKNYQELRDLYARSRFVVIPLFPTDTDNGTTSILEAMAMGKAVICSRVKGQRDVIRDGENGILVPPEDPGALRAAVLHLWNNPEIADRMGREGRAWVERHHTLDAWVGEVRRIVERAVASRNGPLHSGKRSR